MLAFHTTTVDGWSLSGEVSSPPAPPAAVVLGHAMMVDRRTLRRLAARLLGHGLAVLSFDARGHGESGPTAREGARFLYDDFVRFDVPAVVGEARRRFPELPVFVVGHSLIGHAALIAAGHDREHAADGVVAIAANLWAPRFEPSRAARIAKAATLSAWLAVSAPTGHFDARRFHIGTDAEPLPYVRQFASFWLHDALRSVDGADDWLMALRRAELPVMSISSVGDRLLGRPAAIERFVATMHRADVEHRVVRRGELAPGFAPNHMELVTSPRCEPLWDAIADWILARAAG